MTIEIIGAALGQVMVLGGFFFWLSKKNTEKIDRMQVDVAVIKENIRHVRDDHDKLILLDHRMGKTENDINNAFNKIRGVVNG